MLFTLQVEGLFTKNLIISPLYNKRRGCIHPQVELDCVPHSTDEGLNGKESNAAAHFTWCVYELNKLRTATEEGNILLTVGFKENWMQLEAAADFISITED